jgi:endonuclease YncB( thermonuclease family)
VVQRVIDDDTIEVRAAISLGQSLTVRVRIDSISAPEMEARYAEERRQALAARDFLAHRLDGAAVKLTSVVYDKYDGRGRANVADAKGDIASALLASGLVRHYHGEGARLGARRRKLSFFPSWPASVPTTHTRYRQSCSWVAGPPPSRGWPGDDG